MARRKSERSQTIEAVEEAAMRSASGAVNCFAWLRPMLCTHRSGSVRRGSSPRAQGWPRLPASEERTRRLMFWAWRPSETAPPRSRGAQPDPFDPEALLEFGKQRLNLIAGLAASAHRPGFRRGRGPPACGFLPVHRVPRTACRTGASSVTSRHCTSWRCRCGRARLAQAAISSALARGAEYAFSSGA